MKWWRVFRYIGIFLMFYAIYLGVYQAGINEKLAIDDKHCIEVNPFIIARKQAYIDSMKGYAVDGDLEKYFEKTKEYEQASLSFIDKEKEWLSLDQAFINKFVNKLIFDKYKSTSGVA